MIDWTILAVGRVFNLIYMAIIGTIVLYITAKIVKIEDATKMKAFAAALIAAVISNISVLALFGIAGLGVVSLAIPTLLVWFIAWILIILAIKIIYATTWIKAFIAWIIYIVATFVIDFIIQLVIQIVAAWVR